MLAHPLVQKRGLEKRIGVMYFLLRLPSGGHASLRLGLRANAQGAFRTKPAWRPAAARDLFACRVVRGGKRRSRILWIFPPRAAPQPRARELWNGNDSEDRGPGRHPIRGAGEGQPPSRSVGCGGEAFHK